MEYGGLSGKRLRRLELLNEEFQGIEGFAMVWRLRLDGKGLRKLEGLKGIVVWCWLSSLVLVGGEEKAKSKSKVKA